MDLFSVVIPTYNRAKTICRTIDSVLQQTYKNFEIIVVDDGSTDNTDCILEKYKTNKNFIFIRQENGGAQKARNAGLKNSNGKYIMFLDSDDTIYPSFLEKFVKKFELDNDIGCVYCLTGIKNSEGEIVPARNDSLEGYVYKEVLKQGYLTSCSFIAMRKKVFDEIGDWDVCFPASQDDDMCFRLAKKYKIGFLPEILGEYFVDSGNQIGGNHSQVAVGWWLLWNKHEADVTYLLGKNEIVKRYYECLFRFFACKDKEYIKKCALKLKDFVSKKDIFTKTTQYKTKYIRDVIISSVLKIIKLPYRCLTKLNKSINTHTHTHTHTLILIDYKKITGCEVA